ncbi:GAF domain-containing protein [Paeniglutamicibacter gangotriensis]|uniref:GAF domain-containing protein n=1 Tax=Paeniglutamicibacter gangotriensis TaxID=254787 RepID=UPI0037C9C025
MVTTFKWWLGSALLPLIALTGGIFVFAAQSSFGWASFWYGWDLTQGSMVTGFLLSGVGITVGPVISAINQFKIQGQMIADFKTTLVPTAAQLIASAGASSSQSMDGPIYTIMKDLRAFIGTNGTNADANLYLLIDGSPAGGLGTKLERVHRTDTGARIEFKKTKAKNDRALEEAAVVERILDKKQAHCRNVKSRKNQVKFTLDPKADRKYKAFMSVPVLLEDKVIGMLSVNSTDKGVIQNYHFDYLDMVATLVADLHRIRPLKQLSGHNVSNG